MCKELRQREMHNVIEVTDEEQFAKAKALAINQSAWNRRSSFQKRSTVTSTSFLASSAVPRERWQAINRSLFEDGGQRHESMENW
jgi:hypothetical protein